MLDSDIVAILIAKLGDWDEDVRQSTINALAQLAKHGKFLDHR
jgi:hypothetical protein